MKRKPNGYWTEKAVRDEAAKYNTRTEFYKGNQVAYARAHRQHKIMDDLFPIDNLYESRTMYSLEDFKQEALKYSTRCEFRDNSKMFYAAKNRGMLDEACKHMPVNANHVWTEDRVLSLAMQYDNRRRFRMECGGGYQHAQRHGYIDKVFQIIPEGEHTGTESNRLYLWKLGGHHDVYKVGITSTRCGDYRARAVSYMIGCDIMGFFCIDRDDARQIEKEILKDAVIADIGYTGQGCTELIRLNSDEVCNIITRYF